MTSSVTTLQSSPLPTLCDFGWYYGTISSPLRLPEHPFTVGTSTYPPGMTVTAGSVTLPTGANIAVASTATLEASGTIEFYAGTGPSQRTTSRYTVVDGTHIHCTDGVGTFASNTPVFDPRFYVDAVPLQQQVIFDAIDFNNLGLPVTITPSGISVISYRWDFGNGQIGYGPYASTTYTFSQRVPSIQTSLTVTDSLGRQVSCARRLNQQA